MILLINEWYCIYTIKNSDQSTSMYLQGHFWSIVIMPYLLFGLRPWVWISLIYVSKGSYVGSGIESRFGRRRRGRVVGEGQLRFFAVAVVVVGVGVGVVPVGVGRRRYPAAVPETFAENLKDSYFFFKLGSGCSTAVEHTPAEQNTWGSGFNSCQVLGFFLLFLSLSIVSLIKSLKEVQQYWFSFTNMGA